MKSTEGRTARLTGTAILATLVVLFDYTVKFSGLKIPFPWLPYLKFDFTGIPIMLSLLLYGFTSAVTTSLVACLAIVARSGDWIGATMKALAEFSTVLGVAGIIYTINKLQKTLSLGLGIITRITVMSGFNWLILPNFYGIPPTVVLNLLPLIGAFNAIQGAITLGLGYAIYEALIRRLPLVRARE